MTRTPRYSLFVLLPLALLAPLGLAALPVEKAFEPKTGTQWYPFLEWYIENSSYDGNPFDLEAKAVFVHQASGQTVTTPMFFDGQDTWAFRFTGVQTGTWTLHTFSSDEDLSGWSGRAEIAKNSDPEAHGFMKAFGSKWGW